MKHVLQHFRKVDPVLASVAGEIEALTVSPKGNYFSELCEAIINQQLSEKAGETIWQRFVALFPKGKVTPDRVLALSDKKIRSVGTSWSKITYMKNLGRRVLEGTLRLEMLGTMTDDQVVAELTQVKGIGPWTAEMFLMFTLGREDVFSYGDLGLKNAIKKVYKLKGDPTRSQMEKLVKKWSPYRTHAARILWRSLEL